jgi:hypothetical protein
MHEEADFKSRMPEFDAVAILQQRLAQKAASTTNDHPSHTAGTFDPHQIMVKRRSQNAGEIACDHPVQNWPAQDIKTLEDFCRSHGIMGFNCGTMSPLAALVFLKQKLGIMDQTPRSEGYGPNYPYTEAMSKRQLLKG